MTTTSPDKALTAYQAGQCWDVVTDTSNPTSLNIDGLGAIALKLQDGNTSPYTGTILANRFFRLCYNGTSFFVANANALPSNDLLVGDANGNPQPVTLSSSLDSGIGSTRGSILYRGATGWAALSPGTSGYFLQTQGAGANPAWAAAGGGNLSTTGTTAVGYLPKFGSPTTGITNSQCDDGVTTANTLTCAGTGGIAVPNGRISAGSVSVPPPITWLTGGGGVASVADGTCTIGAIPAGVSGLCDKSGLPYWASQVSGNNYQALASNTTTNASYYLKATSTAGIGTYGAIATPDLPADIRTRTCEVVWGGTGTSNVLQSGDDAIANNSCSNQLGITETITAVYCMSDVASNTVTINPTFGATGTGTAILSGALTCGSSYAYSASGTVSSGSVTSGSGISPGMGGTLNAHSIHMLVVYTLP